jgi:hypothetical protein
MCPHAVVPSGIRDQDVHERQGTQFTQFTTQFTTQLTCYAVSAVFAMTLAVLVQILTDVHAKTRAS